MMRKWNMTRLAESMLQTAGGDLLRRLAADIELTVDTVFRAALVKHYGELTPEILERSKAEMEIVHRPLDTRDGGWTKTLNFIQFSERVPLASVTTTWMMDELQVSWKTFIGPLDIDPETLKGAHQGG